MRSRGGNNRGSAYRVGRSEVVGGGGVLEEEGVLADVEDYAGEEELPRPRPPSSTGARRTTGARSSPPGTARTRGLRPVSTGELADVEDYTSEEERGPRGTGVRRAGVLLSGGPPRPSASVGAAPPRPAGRRGVLPVDQHLSRQRGSSRGSSQPPVNLLPSSSTTPNLVGHRRYLMDVLLYRVHGDGPSPAAGARPRPSSARSISRGRRAARGPAVPVEDPPSDGGDDEPEPPRRPARTAGVLWQEAPRAAATARRSSTNNSFRDGGRVRTKSAASAKSTADGPRTQRRSLSAGMQPAPDTASSEAALDELFGEIELELLNGHVVLQSNKVMVF